MPISGMFCSPLGTGQGRAVAQPSISPCYPGPHAVQLDSHGKILNDAMFRANSSADYVARASKASLLPPTPSATGSTPCRLPPGICQNARKEIGGGSELIRGQKMIGYASKQWQVITLVDLAGHERYFKTTAYGLTGHLPDYACLIIGANAGILPLPPLTWSVLLDNRRNQPRFSIRRARSPAGALQHRMSPLESSAVAQPRWSGRFSCICAAKDGVVADCSVDDSSSPQH